MFHHFLKHDTMNSVIKMIKILKEAQWDRSSSNEQSTPANSGAPPQCNHYPSPLIYPLIICELVGGRERARGQPRHRQYRQPRQRGRDENGIENHQTNLLPLSRVPVTSTPVCAHTHTHVHSYSHMHGIVHLHD